MTNWTQVIEDEEFSRRDGYCDYCEKSGHTFRTCERRDDSPEYDY